MQRFTSASFNAIDIHRFQDLQNKIRTKAPLNIVGAAPVVDYKGETFLSQELALNLLYEAKLSLSRCQLVRIACLDSRHSGVSTQVSSNGGGGGADKQNTKNRTKGGLHEWAATAHEWIQHIGHNFPINRGW